MGPVHLVIALCLNGCDQISAWKGELQRFGGHAQAIGLAAEVSRLEELRSTWEQAAKDLDTQVLEKVYTYELELPVAQIGQDLYRKLSQLEPCGSGNRQPILKVGDCVLMFLFLEQY